MTGTGDRPGDGGDAPRWEPPQDRAWSEAEPTGQMPPQQGWAQPAADPGWTQPAAYGPGGDMPRSGSPYAAAPPQQPAPPPQPAPPARSGSGPVAGVLAVLAVLAIVLGAGIGYWVYRSADGGSGAAPTAAPGGDPGAGAAASSTTSSTTTTTEERPSRRDFTPDPGWEKCGGSGEPGDFNLYWAGTDVTSCPFTREVRDAFVDYYRDTGETSGTIRAKSPVTGKSYTMDCRDDGVHVTCTGGNNAVVHIS